MNKPRTDDKPDFALLKENYVLLLIGLAIIVAGFLLMAGGGAKSPDEFNAKELFSFRRVTLAPLIILIGFVFEIYAIMKRPKKGDRD
jgi:hypothetical protein